jgi:Flp pilus assembly protein TadG
VTNKITSPKTNASPRRLAAALHAWRQDERGSFAIIFAFAVVVLVIFVGLGIDYYTGLAAKARLNSAADAAALAAVDTAKAFYAANSGTMSEADLEAASIQAGKAQAQKAFAANTAGTELMSAITPNISINYATLQFTSTVNWAGDVAAHFGPLVGVSSLALGGNSGAVSALPKYLDFYIVTDVSGSMGIPTSAADQLKLIQTNPDNALEASNYPSGCQFACHFAGYQGFNYTQQNNVQIPLKLNTVGTAINSLLTAANTTKLIANQFRVGIFPFIVHAIQAAPLSSDFSNVSSIANNLANYIDNGTFNGGMKSGGTHFENIWTDLASYFQTAGTGASSTSTLPFIILVTDGVDNSQTYSPFTGSWPQLPDSTSPSSFCAKAKNAGYTVAVLYIPYSPIVNPKNIWNDEDAAVNYLIDPTTYPAPPSPYKPNVPAGDNAGKNMQSCASSGYFFSAGTATEINTAMQTIFYQAVAQSRLTQ